MDVIPKLKRESSFESSTTGTSSSDGDEAEFEPIPMELKAEFLSAVMSKKYEDALKLCDIMLRFDGDNELARQYRPILVEFIELDTDDESSDEDSDEDTDDEDSSDSEEEDDDELEQLADSIEQLRVQSGGPART